MSRDLKIVPAPVKSEGHATRAAGLMAQAKAEANAHVADTIRAMGDLTRMADGIACGGDAYPAGVREAARRFAEQTKREAEAIAFLMERSGQ